MHLCTRRHALLPTASQFTPQTHPSYITTVIFMSRSYNKICASGCGSSSMGCNLLSKGIFSISPIFLLLLCLQWGVGGVELTYVWGDALNNKEALGPDGQPYPWDEANKIAGRQRIPRSLLEDKPLLSPEATRKALLSAFESHEYGYGIRDSRTARSESSFTSNSTTTTPTPPPKSEGCVPTRLCETTYNTTAPMYGISLTSGQPVTIVQKFPDLLQQVVYQVCKSEDCDVIQGKCVQTYLPYLFLVIPLGPVTLTGQDYVLVESGCACKPKYASRIDKQPQLPFITPFNTTKPRSNKRL